MSVITPQTNIKLLKLPLELSNTNQLTFTNETDQFNYFNSLECIEGNDYTYQRKDGYIRFEGSFDELINYNYVMYQNESYSDKWFYAYVENIEYLSNESSAVFIKTDVFQTWQFDLTYLPSFVEREHVNDDSIGLHTFPENLETGEYRCSSHTTDSNLDDLDDFCYILACTTIPYLPSTTGEGGKAGGGGVYNGIYSGANYFRCDTENELKGMLRNIAENGQNDSIVGLFMCPKTLVDFGTGGYTGEVRHSSTPVSYNTSISKPNSIDGYTPKNNKLFTYPYSYLLVSNNNGNNNIYHWELFSSTPNFIIEMALCPGISGRSVPLNYNGISRNDEMGINLGKYPICSFQVDMYTNWLTQNSINVDGVNVRRDTLNLLGNAFSDASNLIGNALIGNIGGAVGGLMSMQTNMLNNMITTHEHDLIPPEARGNVNSGDIITASGKNTLHYYKMNVKREYAIKIDNFFSAFGYKVNNLKVPNITGRQNWNYVKTVDINLHGYIPQNDINEIKSLFNNGITLWHNVNTFLDYSQNNPIV